MKIIKGLLIRLHELGASAKAAITSAAAVVAFILGALLEDGVQKAASNDSSEIGWGYFWIAVGVGLALCWGLIRFLYIKEIEEFERLKNRRERAIADARERIARISVNELVECDSIVDRAEVSTEEFRSVLICDVTRIKNLVNALWDVVNAHHNTSVEATERINFEITLIVPSLSDNALTVAAWCNRDNRRPKSLLVQAENRDIFQETEAAKMIRNRTVDSVILEDTSSTQLNYVPLYEGQKARIRSSVLHPILTPKSEHMGVLVLHCEIVQFFKQADQRYWHELFSVFAPSLALELERIKAYNKAVRSWPPAPREEYVPY